jgi:hypothetical protein
MSDYNGWKNKETWLVNVWLGDMLAEYQEEGLTIDAQYIQILVEELVDEFGPVTGFCSDIFNCSLYEIDYRELAEHYEVEAVS